MTSIAPPWWHRQDATFKDAQKPLQYLKTILDGAKDNKGVIPGLMRYEGQDGAGVKGTGEEISFKTGIDGRNSSFTEVLYKYLQDQDGRFFPGPIFRGLDPSLETELTPVPLTPAPSWPSTAFCDLGHSARFASLSSVRPLTCRRERSKSLAKRPPKMSQRVTWIANI